MLDFLAKAAQWQRRDLNTDFFEHVFGVKGPKEPVEVNMGTFIVPMTLQQGKQQINWRLIDDTIDFVKSDLLNFCLSDNTDVWQVGSHLGLLEQGWHAERTATQLALERVIRSVWSCESNQNLFVPIQALGVN